MDGKGWKNHIQGLWIRDAKNWIKENNIELEWLDDWEYIMGRAPMKTEYSPSGWRRRSRWGLRSI